MKGDEIFMWIVTDKLSSAAIRCFIRATTIPHKNAGTGTGTGVAAAGTRPVIFGTKDYQHGITGEKVSLDNSSECLGVKV